MVAITPVTRLRLCVSLSPEILLCVVVTWNPRADVAYKKSWQHHRGSLHYDHRALPVPASKPLTCMTDNELTNELPWQKQVASSLEKLNSKQVRNVCLVTRLQTRLLNFVSQPWRDTTTSKRRSRSSRRFHPGPWGIQSAVDLYVDLSDLKTSQRTYGIAFD